MEKKELDVIGEKERFIHRDLSWLMFNERVLEEAEDVKNPLLERLRFLAIYINNLDEFLMVRYAGHQKLLDSSFNNTDKFGYYPYEIIAEINERLSSHFKRIYNLYGNTLKSEMRKARIYFRKLDELTSEQNRFVKRYFEKTLFPIVTPMAVDQSHPFPVLYSKTLAFAVLLKSPEKDLLSIIPIPGSIPRLLKLPSNKDDYDFILIDDILKSNLETFFKGYEVKASLLFKIIRDSELDIEEEQSPDLLKFIEGEIKKRILARVIRLEVEKEHNNALLELLCEKMGFSAGEARKIEGDLDLKYLFSLVSAVKKSELFYPSFETGGMKYDNIFDRIKEGDFLLNVPYESFQPTVDLLTSAAKDRNVLAIKMTLYRVDEDSAIIKALKEAAKNKKQVTVLVEIKARFDEERNINWAKELELEGCHVVYGIPGLKIHSKITLVVRREEGSIVRYVHLATGNYNEKTAKIYTDAGLFTCNEDYARDISDVFNVITGYSLPSRWKRIVSSPNDMRQYIFELIDKEIDYQKKYKNGFIFAKMNSLEDTKIIDKLYEASSKGVKISLIVRGICCLVPGLTGLSENIKVLSIVGRFLEHTRIFEFGNNGDKRIFLSSADWMSRNFDRRIELLFEIYKDEIKDSLSNMLRIYWRDSSKARELKSTRQYSKFKAGDGNFNSQEFLIKKFGR